MPSINQPTTSTRQSHWTRGLSTLRVDRVINHKRSIKPGNFYLQSLDFMFRRSDTAIKLISTPGQMCTQHNSIACLLASINTHNELRPPTGYRTSRSAVNQLSRFLHLLKAQHLSCCQVTFGSKMLIKAENFLLRHSAISLTSDPSDFT